MFLLFHTNLIYTLNELYQRRNIIETELNRYRLMLGRCSVFKDDTLDKLAQKYAELLAETGELPRSDSKIPASNTAVWEKEVGWTLGNYWVCPARSEIPEALGNIDVAEKNHFCKFQSSKGYNCGLVNTGFNLLGVGIVHKKLKGGLVNYTIIILLSYSPDTTSMPETAKQMYVKPFLKVTDTNYHIIIREIENQFKEAFIIFNGNRNPGIKRNGRLDKLANQKLKRILACSSQTDHLDCLVEKKVKDIFGSEKKVNQFHFDWRVFESWPAFFNAHEKEYREMAQGEFGISVLFNVNKSYHVCVISVSPSVEES